MSVKWWSVPLLICLVVAHGMIGPRWWMRRMRVESWCILAGSPLANVEGVDLHKDCKEVQ